MRIANTGRWILNGLSYVFEKPEVKISISIVMLAFSLYIIHSSVCKHFDNTVNCPSLWSEFCINLCFMSQITLHLVRLAHLIEDIVFPGNVCHVLTREMMSMFVMCWPGRWCQCLSCVDQGDDVYVCHVLTREMMSMFVMCWPGRWCPCLSCVDQGDDVHVCHVLTREMMSMMSQLILHLDTSEHGVFFNGEAICIAMCNLARLHAHKVRKTLNHYCVSFLTNQYFLERKEIHFNML